MLKPFLFASFLLPAALWSAGKPTPLEISLAWPLAGARYRIEYLDSISSPEDLAIKRGLLARLGDIVLGPSEKPRKLLRPFTIATDADGRILVADPDARAVHIFDPARHKHRLIQGPSRQRLESPVGIDCDSAGNLYVADSMLGRIFVFSKDGDFLRFIGGLKGGEGVFKRPTGLAVDRASNRIYLTDTLRHRVYVLSPDGVIEREWGARGEGPGEFNYPTAVALAEDRVFVLDAMNFRVQSFTPDGKYLGAFGHAENAPGGFFRPKGLAVDARRKLVLVVDAMFEAVQAFTFEGKLVFAFGEGGARPGQFRLPAGICFQADGRVLVADTLNRRIQVFRAAASGDGK